MIITKTPFRLGLFGGGTDYPEWYKKHGGCTLTVSLDHYCYVTLRRLPPFRSHKTRVVWTKIELVNKNVEIEHPMVNAALRFMDMEDGLEIHHDGDLPGNSGMGTSSAFTVGLLNALYALRKVALSPNAIAYSAVNIERNLAGENIGCQDQFSAAIGGMNLFQISTKGIVAVNHFNDSEIGPRLRNLENYLMLFFTGFSRNASKVAEAQIREMDNHEESMKRMMDQTYEAVNILFQLEADGRSTSMTRLGKLLHEAWMLKRTLSPIITMPEIDSLYERFLQAGAIGGKLCGAGFGGFFLLVVPPECKDSIRAVDPNLVEIPVRFAARGTEVIFDDSSA